MQDRSCAWLMSRALDRQLVQLVHTAQADGHAKHVAHKFLHASVGAVTNQGQCQDDLLQPYLGDGKRKQNFVVIYRLCKGRIQGDLSFVPLLVNKLSADLILSGEVADIGGTGQGLNSQLDALCRAKFGRRTGRCGHADVLL